jgi:hypothetical protein
MNVRFEASITLGQPTFKKTPLAAQNEASSMFTHCGRRCCEICGIENVEHLRNALLCNYELTIYWGGALYYGITLKWDLPETYIYMRYIHA